MSQLTNRGSQSRMNVTLFVGGNGPGLAALIVKQTTQRGMKSLLPAIAFLSAASQLLGQGSISLANYVAGAVNAPVTNAAGNLIVGPPYLAHFFWSSNTQSTMDNLEPAGFDAQFSTFQGGGYFLTYPVNLPVGVMPILAQIRVWDTNYGSGYYQARDNGGEFGFSNLIIAYPTIPLETASPLFGLEGFQLQRLPRLRSSVSVTNTIVFSWLTEQTCYTVQQNPDPSGTNWMTVSNAPVTVGQNQQVVLPAPPTGSMFYRLVSQ